jgi:lipid A oxidase
MYRWFLGNRGEDFIGRFQPYAGVGIGAVIPHVESIIGGTHFEEYQWQGPGVQGFLGTNFDLTRHWSIFAEYKLSYVDLELSIPGGSINVTPWTHHFVVGVSFRF